MGYDRKYGKVTTEFGSIGNDEPVVVFRARDSLLPRVLMYYHLFCMKSDCPRYHLNTILDTFYSITQWQFRNKDKVRFPRSEGFKNRQKNYRND